MVKIIPETTRLSPTHVARRVNVENRALSLQVDCVTTKTNHSFNTIKKNRETKQIGRPKFNRAWLYSSLLESDELKIVGTSNKGNPFFPSSPLVSAEKIVSFPLSLSTQKACSPTIKL
jgi:hypothetical protein